MSAQQMAVKVVGLAAIGLVVYAVYKVAGVFVDVNAVIEHALSSVKATYGCAA